ncbi:MAG: nuclear transport factor 2 family protein [Betaproteobacteria bacterium]|jgi:limonene-1,2-epoxide hydrolase
MTPDELVRAFETLQPESVAELDRVYTPDARFRDPFNDVCGIDNIRAIFSRMYETLDAPRFHVTNRIVEADQAMLEWDFTFRVRRFRPGQGWLVHGVTHVRFAQDGRIRYHRDFWDTGEELYAHLPGIGALVRWLRRRMA